jgi:hypothetical protein
MKEMGMSLVRLVIVAFSLMLAAAPGWAQAPGSAPVAAAPLGLQGFGIVLVLGDMQDGGTGDSVPPGARAALADLKDFLPYRSYRVLDTAWLLASSMTRQAITSRLRGPDEQDYEVVLDRLALPPTTLQVHFTMREPSAARQAEAAARHTDRLALLKRQLMEAYEQLKRVESQQNRSDSDVEAVRRRVVALEADFESLNIRGVRYVPGEATLIDTTFTMSLGETVVVGTSRMRGGNKALIVLLTAATKGAKPRE